MTYAVQADCYPDEPGLMLSDPATATLWRWGDVNNDGVVDFVDITMVVEGFRHEFDTPFPCSTDEDCSWFLGPFATCDTSTGRCKSTIENLDIMGGFGCPPDGVIDFTDITRDVDAFKNRPDPCRGVCP